MNLEIKTIKQRVVKLAGNMDMCIHIVRMEENYRDQRILGIRTNELCD